MQYSIFSNLRAPKSGFVEAQWAIVVLILLSLTRLSSVFAQDKPHTPVKLRSKAYKVNELYTDGEADATAYEALTKFLTLKFLLSGDDKDLQRIALDIRMMSTGLAKMQEAYDSMAESPNILQKEQLDLARSRFSSEANPKNILDAKVRSGEISDDRKETLLAAIDRARQRAEDSAWQIWNLRTQTIQYSHEKKSSLPAKKFEEELDKNLLWKSDEFGRGEVNSIDGQVFIRVLHRDFKEAFTFKAEGEIHHRSFHNHKYTATQHQKSGKDRGDNERGRDEVACYTTKTNDPGAVKIDAVRVHLRPKKWDFINGGYLQYRSDAILHLHSKWTKDDVIWGIVVGFAQSAILAGMDYAMHWMGVTDADIRWKLYIYTFGFSTFWGFFQSALGKFTNDPFLSIQEKTLRRAVTTGLPYNIAAYLLTYGHDAFDMQTAEGMMNWGKLMLNIGLSNMVKDKMEKPSEVDERARINTKELILRIPSRSIPGYPLTDEIVEIKIAEKKKNLERRLVSLKTFTYRLADISDVKLKVPYVDYEIPIGKIFFWSAYPYYEWKAVKHAESRASDLTPMLKANWEKAPWPLSRIPILKKLKKPILFKYVVPIVPVGYVGAIGFNAAGTTLRAGTRIAGEITNRALFHDKEVNGEVVRQSRLRTLGQSLKKGCAGLLGAYVHHFTNWQFDRTDPPKDQKD